MQDFKKLHQWLYRLGLIRTTIVASFMVALVSLLLSMLTGKLIFGHVTNEFIVTPLVVSGIVAPIITYTMLALIFQLDDVREKLNDLAIYDSLTGVYNRGYFIQLYNIETQRAKRTNKSFALCIMDIDYFKQVNDEYGHVVGDEILKHLADTCQRCCRSHDLIGRFGGDELVLLLPETEKPGVESILKRLIEEIKNNPPSESGVKYTVSVGAVVADPAEHDFDKLLAGADKVMYVVKSRGRDDFLVY